MPSINEMKKKKKPFNPDVIDLVMEDVASNSPATDEISLFSNNRVAQNEEKTLDLKKRPTMFLEHKKIYPNPLNKRYVAHLTDNDFNILKASIMEMGLMHNLVVLEDGKGGYRLLSGEKRWTAIGKMTEEEMKKHLPDGIEAKVIPYDPYLSVIDEHIMLLTCNVLIFSAGSPDPIQLRDLVRLYKKKGYEKNEIKDYLEFYLTYSSNNLYKVINEANAIDELLELFNQGALTKTALQSFGALSTEQQKLAYAKIIKEGIEKVDQELANQIKKQIKESTKNPGSTEASAAFIKYDKILNSEIKDIEKALSLKLETMNYNELSHSITKLKLLSEKVNKLIFTSEKALNEKKK